MVYIALFNPNMTSFFLKANNTFPPLYPFILNVPEGLPFVYSSKMQLRAMDSMINLGQVINKSIRFLLLLMKEKCNSAGLGNDCLYKQTFAELRMKGKDIHSYS